VRTKAAETVERFWPTLLMALLDNDKVGLQAHAGHRYVRVIGSAGKPTGLNSDPMMRTKFDSQYKTIRAHQ
jgi:hypothetical protein